MEKAIRDFAKQFAFEPEIQNPDRLKKFSRFVVVGMGGSHLSSDLLKVWKPNLDLIIHQNYGLPALPSEELENRLIILNSYSGNTEEVLRAFDAALRGKFSMIAISIGGKLLELAKKHGVPYVQMPDTGIQPRLAIGFNCKALLKTIGEEEALKEISKLAETFKPDAIESAGKALAVKLRGKVPVVYVSQRDAGIAYNWKAKLNETAKIPAFWNVFPELNHNEMTGFDVSPSTRRLSENFHFIFLRDPNDNPRTLKRMAATKKIYEERGLPVEVIEFEDHSVWRKIFQSMILADWTAYHLALIYGVEPEQVPLIEEFKRLII